MEASESTGVVQEHILAISWDVGANGKSALINAMLGVLGRDYAMKANTQVMASLPSAYSRARYS
jgi:hypothetical protein